MAADIQQGDDGLSPIATINVTPFVDVVLVLLVIFLVTAPIFMRDTLDLKLPKSQSGSGKTAPTLALVVSKRGQIFLNGEPSSREQVFEEAQRALAKNSDVQAVLSADTEAQHGDVVKAMDWLQSAGVGNFAIQIERP